MNCGLQSEKKRVSADDLYQWHLRLIYRLLFLMVIEERDLVFPRKADKKNRDIYYKYYSIERLRNLTGRPGANDDRHRDYWIVLKKHVPSFSSVKHLAHPWESKPLAGDLFRSFRYPVPEYR